ncbi:unnamed protein product [Spirodela intermedia]|uniref:U-box domain-containing protein n=1 Tax=Spirodela intermedia TaxID=51605 RepID=A0A7I8ISK9_SPIIN|nr:unnamed protein product [Spirodela intermedia]CAA6660510.1 unnamed protein product [Spirodela intermedia]
MDADGVEVPRYFVCPISLQIMKDPVTVATGITYDRESIERWLFVDNNLTCPLTNQPLARESELTPNHTLRRLIQAWCMANASQGSSIHKLLQDLSVPKLESNTLRLLSTLASDSESNRRSMVQAGVPKSMVSTIVDSHRRNRPDRVEEALAVLIALKASPEELKPLIGDNHDLIESLTRALKHASSDSSTNGPRSHAIVFLKCALEVANPTLGERLKSDFFMEVVSVLKARSSPQTIKAALQVLLDACPMGTNRSKIVEAGARTSELVLGVLDHLCNCADGRAELVGHAAGIAVVAKRILRVSPAADDRAVRILSSVCKFSATNELLQEMLKVGAVSKLCLEKARWVLRSHSEAWRNSPCIATYLITRYP